MTRQKHDQEKPSRSSGTTPAMNSARMMEIAAAGGAESITARGSAAPARLHRR